MKKKFLTITLLALTMLTLFGCQKGTEEAMKNNKLVVAESSSGDVVINFDEKGNPVEMIDANGDIIDLTAEGTVVEKDEKTGKIISVTTTTGEKVEVRQTATAEEAEKVIENSEKKKAEEAEAREVGKQEYKTKDEILGPKDKVTGKVTDSAVIDTTKKGTTDKADKTESTVKENAVSKTMYPKSLKGGMVSVYADYSEQSTIIGTLIPGVTKSVNVFGETNTGWSHVRYDKSGTQTEGWVLSGNLSTTAPEVVDDKLVVEKPEGAVEDIADDGTLLHYIVYSTPYVDTGDLSRVNAIRKENGVDDITWNSSLESAAKDRLWSLVTTKNGLNHGYGKMVSAAENLAQKADDRDIIDMYKNSTGHLNNMLQGATMVSVYTDATYINPYTGTTFTVTKSNNLMAFDGKAGKTMTAEEIKNNTDKDGYVTLPDGTKIPAKDLERDKSKEQPSEQPSEKPSEKSSEKQSEKASEKPSEQPASEKPSEKAGEQPSQAPPASEVPSTAPEEPQDNRTEQEKELDQKETPPSEYFDKDDFDKLFQ